MDHRERAFLRRALRFSTIILVLLGLIGMSLTALLARREMRQYEALEGLRIQQEAASHFAAVQEYLGRRENLAKVLGALFNASSLTVPRPLGEFGNRVIELVPDVSTIGWLPEIQPTEAADAIMALAAAGVRSPQFLGRDATPIDPKNLDRPLYPIVDIAPERNRSILGVDAGAFPERLAAIRQARDTRSVAGTPPLRLVQSPEATSILLYSPIYATDGRFLGVLGFGYQIEHLFRGALNVPLIPHSFNIRVMAGDDAVPLFAVAADGSTISVGQGKQFASGETDVVLKTTFGGRPMQFVYSISRDIGAEAARRGWWIAGFGLSLTLSALAFVGFVINRTAALEREVTSRRSAEDRLKVLIHELNHRVRNVLSVVQAVVRLSFTSAYSLTEAQRICEGRLRSLANAMTLLTNSDWKSVSIHQLISQEIVPFSDRIILEGPDMPLKARAAQTFSLLIYELATNAAKHGALSVSTGKVLLKWMQDRSGDKPLFRLHWREIGGPTVIPPTRRGFGELLIRRIAPRDVAGQGKVSYETGGFQYELEAPLHEVLSEPNSTS